MDSHNEGGVGLVPMQTSEWCVAQHVQHGWALAGQHLKHLWWQTDTEAPPRRGTRPTPCELRDLIHVVA